MTYPNQPRQKVPAKGFWRPGPLLIAAVASLLFGCCGAVCAFIPFASFIVLGLQIALLVITIRQLLLFNSQEQHYLVAIDGKWMALVAIGVDAFAIIASIVSIIVVIGGIYVGGGNS